MGIPDAASDPRSAAYRARCEEKSFRGLLKLFNRACEATGRPVYEDRLPAKPLRPPREPDATASRAGRQVV